MAVNYQNPVAVGAANLPLMAQEQIGPKTNSRSVAMLHPDRHQTTRLSQILLENGNRINCREVWLPTKTLNNIQLKNGKSLPDTNTGAGGLIQGENAVYVAQQYGQTVTGEANAITVKNQYGTVEVPPERQLLEVLELNQSGSYEGGPLGS